MRPSIAALPRETGPYNSNSSSCDCCSADTMHAWRMLFLAALVAVVVRAVDDDDDEFEGAPAGANADEHQAARGGGRGKKGGKRKAKKGRPFTLQHSFDGGETFLPRARLEVITSKLSQHRVIKFVEPGVMLQQELEVFKDLVKSDGFYRVRVVADAATSAPSGDADGPYVMASIRACQMLLHQFDEQFLFHMDDANNIISLEYQNPHAPDEDGDCPVARLHKRQRNKLEFKSSATVFMPVEAAPIPLRVVGNPFVKGAKPAGNGKPGEAGEAEKPQPGFFRRYWYIIVPVGLLMVLSSAMDPEVRARPRWLPALLSVPAAPAVPPRSSPRLLQHPPSRLTTA